jgi:hypothetical protein
MMLGRRKMMNKPSLEARMTKAGEANRRASAERHGCHCSGRSGPRNRCGCYRGYRDGGWPGEKSAGRCGQNRTASLVASGRGGGGRRPYGSSCDQVRLAADRRETDNLCSGRLRPRLRCGLVDPRTTVDQERIPIPTEERMDLSKGVGVFARVVDDAAVGRACP